MATKAVIVINTDMMDDITRDPLNFVEVLRQLINTSPGHREYFSGFGIEFVDTQHSSQTGVYTVGPTGTRGMRA